MIKKVYMRIFNSESNRNTLILISGSVIAQAIPVMAYPVLTRLYTPESFGVLALFMSIYGVLSVIITGRFELAIISPKEENEARLLTVLSIALSFLLSSVSFIGVLFFGDVIAVRIFDLPAIGPWLYVVPLAAFFRAVYQSFNYLANRQKEYKRLAYSRVSQTSSITAVNIIWGLIQPVTAGLIVGRVFGTAFSALILLWQTVRKSTGFFTGIKVRELKRMFRAYEKFPKHLIVSHVVSSVNTHFATFIIARFFGSAILGFFAIAYQLVVLPTWLIATNLGDVFRQEATEVYLKEGNFDQKFRSTLKKAFLLGIFPFVIFVLFAPDLFALFFGAEWRIAGEYSRILSILTFIGFVSTPVDRSALIVGKTGYIFFFHILRLILNLISLLIVYYLEVGIVHYLWIMVAINGLMYIMDLIINYRFSMGYKL